MGERHYYDFCVPETNNYWCQGVFNHNTGKTTLCNALKVARKWIHCVSHIRGVMSGYKADKAGTEDFGLIPKIKDKTLVIKDGDTLLQTPNLPKILAELRDLYDTSTASHFLQGAGREYDNIRTTILLCGTDSLRILDDSELGQRFLDCIIMDQIDDSLEEDICMRSMHEQDQVKGYESNGRPEERQAKEMTLAMQLTGGYAEYLRKHSSRLLDELPVMTDRQNRQIYHLGHFVAHMRARPSSKQKETKGREMSARLCLQLRKLAYCLAVVLNKKEVDDEVMRRVRKVALDTSRGRTLDICRELYDEGEEGLELRYLATAVNQKMEECRQYMAFLREKTIGVAELAIHRGKASRSHWKLTDKIRKLYKEIVVDNKKKEKV